MVTHNYKINENKLLDNFTVTYLYYQSILYLLQDLGVLGNLFPLVSQGVLKVQDGLVNLHFLLCQDTHNHL